MGFRSERGRRLADVSMRSGKTALVAAATGILGMAPTVLATTPPVTVNSLPPAIMPGGLIDVEMASAQVGWAVEANGQVMKTEDGGQRWTDVAPKKLASALQASARTWTPPLDGGPTQWVFPNAWTAWIVTEPDQGNHNAVEVWHTTDGGGRWSEATLAPAVTGWHSLGYAAITALGNQDAWVLTTGNDGFYRLWQSTRRRPTWAAVAHGTFDDGGLAGLAFFTGRNGVLVENGYQRPEASLLASTSGGRSWRARPITPSGAATRYPQLSAPSVVSPTLGMLAVIWHASSASAPPSDPSALIDLYRTTTHGVSWHLVGPLPTRNWDTTLTLHWINAHQGWLLTTPGNAAPRLYATNTGGLTWHRVSLPSGIPLSLEQVSTTDGFELSLAGSHAVLYRTTDGALQWKAVNVQ